MGVGPLLADRVWDITTTTGTGALTLNNAPSKGYQSFLAGIGDGNSCYYTIQEQSGSNWEVGIGTYTDSGTTLSRDTILASSNAGAAVSFGAGTKDVFITANVSVIHKHHVNLLCNSGFGFWQSRIPGTMLAINQNANGSDFYPTDRWRTAVQNQNNYGAIRVDTVGALETGLLSRYYAKYSMNSTVGGTTGKMLICQVIEASNTFDLAGKLVVFQIKMKASSAKTMRFALLQATSAATVDVWPTETGASGTHSMITGSGTLTPIWNANGTDPTFMTNIAKVAPNKILTIGGASSSIVNTALNCFATTVWQTFAAQFIMPTNAKNVAVAVWTDSGFALNDYFCVAEAGFYQSQSVVDWNPDSPDQELRRCQRYYQKSYPVDIAPGTASVEGSNRLSRSVDNSNYLFDTIWFDPPMRATPAFSNWDEAGDGTYTTRCFANGTTDNGVGTVQAQIASSRRMRLASSSVNPLAGYGMHWTAIAEL
jgi:hypothetical protein